MPNRKKQRKNKEKAAAAAAAASAGTAVGSSQRPPPLAPTRVATTTTSPVPASFVPPFLCCRHLRVVCDMCYFSFPTGCWHSLRQDERAELNEIMHVYVSLDGDKKLEQRLEHATAVERQRLVRFYLFMAIKAIIGRMGLVDIGAQENRYKGLAAGNFRLMLSLFGVVKCGSFDAKEKAISANVDMALLDDNQLSCRALTIALENVHFENYHGLVCILNELSPCDCLEAEVERSRVEEESVPGQLNLWACANGCGEKEEYYYHFRCCAGCTFSH